MNQKRKNNFLNSTIEYMKKIEEELRHQKKKVEDDFKEEIIRYENNLLQIKLQLATTTFEKEMKIENIEDILIN